MIYYGDLNCLFSYVYVQPFRVCIKHYLGQNDKQGKLDRKENNGFIPKKLYKNENENMNEKKKSWDPFRICLQIAQPIFNQIGLDWLYYLAKKK